jgi:hypothetical protein
MSTPTKVDPQMVLDLLNAADCDEWKDPSVREMFRLVALGFRQTLAERDELNEDARSFERELTTIARRPDRRQGESRVCFWLRRIGEQLAEEADRTEKMKAERDAIKAEAVRLSEVVHSLCSDELAAALAAWRGLSGEERAQAMRLVYNMPDPAGEIVERLLKAAGR